MSRKITMSYQTRTNWLIDAAVFLGGLLATITGIYFLFLPTGGYRGGRNPMYGVTFLFDRHTWEDWHTWTGIAMIAAAVIHLAIHWPWVKTMSKRIVNAIANQGSGLSQGARLNVLIDALVVVSFALTAVSGLYFFVWPSEGGRIGPVILFTSATWDAIHTWAFVVMVGAIAVHFWIHWRWVTQVTSRFFLSLWQKSEDKSAASVGVQEAV